MANRYSVNGNDDDRNVVEGTVVGGRDREPGQEVDLDFLDAIGNIAQDFKDLKQKHQKTLAKAYERSLKKRQAKARRGDRGGSVIKVHRSGLFARPDPRDLARYQAAKAITDRFILVGGLVKGQTQLALLGKQCIMDAMEEVIAMDNDTPDVLRPLGEALTGIISEELPGIFTEGLTMSGEMGLLEISLATNPGQ